MFQYYSWNLRGQSLEQFGEWVADSSNVPCGLVALQEVASLEKFSSLDVPSVQGPLKEYSAAGKSELHDFHIFGSSALDSYLSQVILLERHLVEHFIQAFSFGRGVGVRYMPRNSPFCHVFVSVHFPHSGNSDDEYEEAIQQLS